MASGTTPRRQVSRRWVLGIGSGILAATYAGGLATEAERGTSMQRSRRGRIATPVGEEGRLVSRPNPPTQTVSPGLHALGLDPTRDALLYVPASFRPDQPAPFVLSLHGAGGNQEGGLYPLRELADESGIVLLSPASRRQTWDVILGAYGPDIAFIDLALAAAFERCAVDPARLAVAGFSDGASYALSIGLTNGELFRYIMAFSPGFAAPAALEGRPRMFVSHGTRDEVLRIDQTSREVVPRLQRAGYDVRYREFDGPHTVPPDVARDALRWFLTGTATPRPGDASPGASSSP